MNYMAMSDLAVVATLSGLIGVCVGALIALWVAERITKE